MKAFKWVLGVIVIAGLAVGGYIVWERLSRVETTDDAQVDGSVFPLSPRVAGHVIKVAVQDQAAVKANTAAQELARAEARKKSTEEGLESLKKRIAAAKQSHVADEQAAKEAEAAAVPLKGEAEKTRAAHLAAVKIADDSP